MLMNQALAALGNEEEICADDIRAWLPQPTSVLYMAQHEWVWSWCHGTFSPGVVFGFLYLKIGCVEDAATVAEGLLAAPAISNGEGFGITPLVRIEALRILGKCRGQRGDAAGACEALGNAASEAAAVGCVFMDVAVFDCISACVLVCVMVCVYTCVHACVCVFMYMQNLHACLPACMHACIFLSVGISANTIYRYVFMEMVSLRDMQMWFEGDSLLPGSIADDSESSRLLAKIAAAEAKFVQTKVSRYDAEGARQHVRF